MKYSIILLLSFQEFYNKVFASSRLQTHSGLDMSCGSVESGLNLFLIPLITTEGKLLIK